MSPNDRLPFYRRLHLYARERRLTHMLRNQVAAVSSILEVVLSVLVLIALLISMVPIAGEMFSLVSNKSTDAFQTFLGHAFNLVIGIEFVKMLAKHSPGSALEVLLYAIARSMILDHSSPLGNLISVVSIGVIFLIRRFIFVPCRTARPRPIWANPTRMKTTRRSRRSFPI